MRTVYVRNWIRGSSYRLQVLLALTQPLTATHLARRTRIDRDVCSKVLGLYSEAFIVRVLNPDATRSRLYWLTDFGQECRELLDETRHCRWRRVQLPEIDWLIYGWLHYSHRSAILRALSGAMSPSAVKRQIRRRDENVAISRGNIRVALRDMARAGVVERVFAPRRKFALYRLTPVGIAMQSLMKGAEAFA